MAKQYEDARAQGLTVSYSVDEAVGIAVNQLMFVRRITRKELGQALGVSGPNAGRKLRGEVTWTMGDLMKAAELLDVEPTSLVPRRAQNPALVAQGGIFDVVALASYTANTPVALRPPAGRIDDRQQSGRRRVTARDRTRIIELYQDGKSTRFVASEVSVSKATVLNTLKRAQVEIKPVGVRY